MSTAAPAPQGSVDFGRSFTFVTEDPDWIKKILIGGLFTLACFVLVGVPFVLGYFARTLRNVAAGAARPMPEWDDLGGIFGEGLRLTAVYLVYVLVVGAVMAVPVGLVFLPLLLVSGGHGDVPEAVGVVGGLGMVGLYGIAMVLYLVLTIFLPAALARATMRGTVADGFALREILLFVKANVGNYLITLVIFLLASFLAQFGILLCCVGFLPAAFWSYMVLAVALGQTVRLSGVRI